MKGYYLGGDVSKGYCDFILLDKSSRIVEKNFQLDDTHEGHKALSTKLISFLKSNPQANVYVGFESTGGYEDNWIHMLIQLSSSYNIKVARINSLGPNHHHKACLRRNITDPISAKNVAEYLINHSAQVRYNQQRPLAEARSLYGHIELLTKQGTQLLNLLEIEVYKSNPSLMCYWKDEMPQWLLSVINQWPTASDLSQASVKEIVLIPYVSRERALELKKNAGKSVASTVSELTEITIQSLVAQIIQKRETITRLKRALYKALPSSEKELLKSLPGISDYSACGLILEIDGVERFDTAKKLCSYFGIHPVYKKSGDGVGGFHMSKQGRRRPRRLLYLAAMNATHHDQMFKGLYERQLKAGRVKKNALCIIMHKMVRIIFGMLKSKKRYDPMININHREQYYKRQSQMKDTNKEVKQARRLQEHDEMAPISRRQAKKRKMLMDTQYPEQVSSERKNQESHTK